MIHLVLVCHLVIILFVIFIVMSSISEICYTNCCFMISTMEIKIIVADIIIVEEIFLMFYMIYHY